MSNRNTASENQTKAIDTILNAILNTVLDDLQPPALIPLAQGELVEIKHLGVAVDYHHNLPQALEKAKSSKDYEVYQFTGSTKRLMNDKKRKYA